MDDLGAIRLMNAIVTQAMSDYVFDRTNKYKYGKQAKYTKYGCKEVEAFLRSGWGQALLFGVDADYLTGEADKIARERAENKGNRTKISNAHFVTGLVGRKGEKE